MGKMGPKIHYEGLTKGIQSLKITIVTGSKSKGGLKTRRSPRVAAGGEQVTIFPEERSGAHVMFSVPCISGKGCRLRHMQGAESTEGMESLFFIS